MLFEKDLDIIVMNENSIKTVEKVKEDTKNFENSDAPEATPKPNDSGFPTWAIAVIVVAVVIVIVVIVVVVIFIKKSKKGSSSGAAAA
ncbi:hypothetical protein TVAG_581100 [Trichomonas vaginalis G3]|uniref:Uncharacterized protein n=1 Tax=Trichomonas vaginalis (strain ATCC PRA-98 / G3) TaxID=412133 RepID=A2GF97_TRIV3|nr:hypothetical protein TVAGG3_0218520 [Trichomonas vaginalis G3]EAX84171.1 hypothetical protein TVAG_581100 [Trichomonas vaginalis G3]KAI5551745.1 hypothetical protein TVAGG3_0218520 [Trichomonas vaginalis G3]|eukprot:XP_001297101.1 hypothetical protein [Trichomonas vaginalis G3]